MKRIRHMFQALSLALITLAFGAAAWPAPASAAGLNLQRVVAVNTFGSQTRKSATVYCPPGKKVIGTGGELAGLSPKAAIEGIAPLADLSGVTVTGVDLDGNNEPWILRAYANCVDMITSPVQSLQLVSAKSPSNSSDAKSVIVNCPPGRRVVGAGGRVNGVAGKTILDEITPLDQAVVAVGVETGGGTPFDWSVEAFAICANPTSLPGLEIVKQESPISSDSEKKGPTLCPSGKRLLGGSAQINTPISGAVALRQISLNEGPSHLFVSGFETGGGTTAGWSLTARAICAAV
jgi:hypothetical protein